MVIYTALNRRMNSHAALCGYLKPPQGGLEVKHPECLTAGNPSKTLSVRTESSNQWSLCRYP